MSRPQRDFRLASEETYNYYKEKHPDTQINKSQFLKIIRRFNEAIIEYCLETGRMAILPHGFGQLFVNKKKPATYRIDKEGKKWLTLSVDWQTTKRIGKKVYHQNFHTEGYKFRFIWRCKPNFTLKGMWFLKMSRIASRSLAKNLKEDPQKYINIYHEWQSVAR